MANKYEQFLKVLCDTALEAAQKQALDPNDMVSKDYKILRKTRCKGEKPGILTMKWNEKDLEKKSGDNGIKNPIGQAGTYGASPEIPSAEKSRNVDQTPKLYQEFMTQQKNYHGPEGQNEKSKGGIIQELSSSNFSEEVGTKEEDDLQEKNRLKKIEAPKYQIIYSKDVDLGNFMCEGMPSDFSRPKTLKIRIELPRVVISSLLFAYS